MAWNALAPPVTGHSQSTCSRCLGYVGLSRLLPLAGIRACPILVRGESSVPRYGLLLASSWNVRFRLDAPLMLVGSTLGPGSAPRASKLQTARQLTKVGYIILPLLNLSPEHSLEIQFSLVALQNTLCTSLGHLYIIRRCSLRLFQSLSMVVKESCQIRLYVLIVLS